MNKRIISVFVFSAALFSMHAQDGKGGIKFSQNYPFKSLSRTNPASTP